MTGAVELARRARATVARRWAERSRPLPAGGDVPRWVLRVALVAVVGVAVSAAFPSADHAITVAERAGQATWAWLAPLSLDGQLVASALVMWVRRRAGGRVGWLPVLGIVSGLGGSLGANVAAGAPGWHPWWLGPVVSAWPPIALAISLELLISLIRERPAPVVETPERACARLLAEGHGRRQIASALGVSEWEARGLIDVVRAAGGSGRESSGSTTVALGAAG